MTTWCRLCYAATATLALGIGFLAVFFVFDRNAVMDYGGPEDLAFDKRDVLPGETVNLWFKRTTWKRLCPSQFVQHVQIDGRVFDFPQPHMIVPPPRAGLLAPKSRPIHMPLFGDGVTGDAVFWADVSSYCWPTDYWWPIRMTTPKVHFVVKGAP